MTCPDDARLDYWLDEALAEAEAAAIAAHVADCPRCAVRRLTRLTEERLWQAALALDGAELAYLARANLAAAWRTAAAPAVAQGAPLAHWLAALAVFGGVAAYGAWSTALPAVGEGAGWLSRLGLVGIGLSWLLGQLWDAGSAIDLLVPGDPTLLLAAASFALWLFVARPWVLVRTD